MEVKMEVNSLHSWKLKWTIVNEAARLGARASKNFLFNFMDALAPWRAVKRGASYNFET